MSRFIMIACVLFALPALVGCGEDDVPVGSAPAPMVGVWLFDSASTNDAIGTVPPDTLRFRSNYTGSYRSSWLPDWDPYDFAYSTYIDTIVRVRTAGNYVGKTDTSRFELTERHLMMQIVDSIGVRTWYLTRSGH